MLLTICSAKLSNYTSKIGESEIMITLVLLKIKIDFDFAKKIKKIKLASPGFEPETFSVLD